MGEVKGAPVLVREGTAADVLERLPLIVKQVGGYDETWLQNLLFRHPSCLPIEEIEPGFGRPSQPVQRCRPGMAPSISSC